MKKITVMVAGLSPNAGKMAKLVAEAVGLQEDMSLYPSALSEEAGDMLINHSISKSTEVRLITLDDHASFCAFNRAEIDLIVDFTLPSAVNCIAMRAFLLLWGQPVVTVRSWLRRLKNPIFLLLLLRISQPLS
jgi:dihydrodipicolinate reductase